MASRKAPGDPEYLGATHALRKSMAEDLRRISIRVRGTVQGVGFRPFVYRIARTQGITGWVLNDTLGVLIEA